MTFRFELPEEFNVNNAQDTLQALRLWLAENPVPAHQTIEISAQAVMEIDGAGLQLLSALSRSGFRWKIVDASSKFESVCRSIGCENWLTEVVLPPAMEGVSA